jgi:murein DD-endopeptidase MepM/ murein hydrolase activator NlpD
VWIPLLLLVCALTGLAAGVGYHLAGRTGQAPASSGPEEPEWMNALREQREELSEARNQAQNHLNALATRLGQMQGQLLRVEALGQKLSEKAELDTSEFDFGRGSAQGGPADPLSQEQLASFDFMRALDELALKIDDRALQLQVLDQVVSARELQQAVSPAGRPINKGWLSSYYGMRKDPFHGRREMHKGIDFAGNMGDPIVATAAGVVSWAGKRYGYGQLVEIKHGNGYATRYGHCREILVKSGDRVQPGQTIALMGSSGRSTGPHVHYEVLKDGRQINPTRFVRASR